MTLPNMVTYHITTGDRVWRQVALKSACSRKASACEPEPHADCTRTGATQGMDAREQVAAQADTRHAMKAETFSQTVKEPAECTE